MTATALAEHDAPHTASADSGAPGNAGPRVAQRNGFLDAVRAVALVRVIIWHTFAAAPISWIVASMPAMYFVAGSLLAGSLDRKPFTVLLRDRLRRLLVPFWAFGAVVLVVLALVHVARPDATTALSPVRLLAWVVPLADPRGSAWEAGWVSTPLWYLRCYLWLLVLAPVLRTLQRRVGAWSLLPSLAGVFLVDLVVRHPDLAPAALVSARWYLGDVATYSVFLLLGFAHRDGVFSGMDRRALVEWVGIGSVAAVVWLQVADVPGLVVNDSYPLLLFVGLAWLAVFLLAEPVLAAAAVHRVTAPVVVWLGRRSMTVYLWHPVAIVAGYYVRSRLFPHAPAVLVLPVVAVGVVVLAVLFGRIEDVAARRPPQWWPGRPDPARWRRLPAWLPAATRGRTVPVAAGFVAACLVAAVFVPDDSAGPAATTGATPNGGAGLALPPAPSARPTTADFGAAATDAAAPTSGPTPAATGATGGDLRSRVTAAVDAWREQHGVAGVVLGVDQPDGTVTTVASGSATDGTAFTTDMTFPATSVTKTMTSAIILQLVGEGRIGLDDPLPAITAVPGLAFVGKVTVRQLLNHTAGVEPYDESPGYATARAGALTPEQALGLIKDRPLQWTPGTQGGYSNSGYLTLGLLAQQLTGKPYATLLATRVFGPAGMTASSLDDTPTAGWAGFSAGGVVSTVADLDRWGAALYRDATVLPPAQLAQMLDVDNQFSAGLGTFPVCPCSTAADGSRVYASIGHNGGQATVQYSPADQLVISAYLSESMWTDHLTQQATADLLAAVREAVGS